MGHFQRAGHMDVSNTIDVSDPDVVATHVILLLGKHYPDLDPMLVSLLFEDFSRLYSGRFPGFHACDVRYHNTQHVLDVTLAMARLLDGYRRTHPEQGLDSNLALVGIAAALFHDSGYIRRTHDRRHKNGAAYTRVHVRRGIRFISSYLPAVGLNALVAPCARIMHFTGYERELDNLKVASAHEHLLGKLLGTADLIAQMADISYLQKCREYLYEEFTEGGMAGEHCKESYKGALYRSPEQLLRQTPDFMRTAIEVRLDGHFSGVHRYAAAHFDGQHLYMDAIQENSRSLEILLNGGEF